MPSLDPSPSILFKSVTNLGRNWDSRVQKRRNDGNTWWYMMNRNNRIQHKSTKTNVENYMFKIKYQRSIKQKCFIKFSLGWSPTDHQTWKFARLTMMMSSFDWKVWSTNDWGWWLLDPSAKPNQPWVDLNSWDKIIWSLAPLQSKHGMTISKI